MKLRTPFSRLSIVLATASVVLIFLIPTWIGFAEKDSKNPVLTASRAYEYRQVVDLGERTNWKGAEDPRVLMAYCRALLETGRLIPHALRAPNTPEHASSFGMAYWELLRGRVTYSEQQFRNLQKIKGFWGYVGELEIALTINDFSSMARVLKDSRSAIASAPASVSSTMHYYSLLHLQGTAEYDHLGEELDTEAGRSLPPEWTAPMHATLLLRRNEFARAHEKLDAALAKVEFDSDVVLAKASVLAAEKGTAVAAEYLKGLSQKYPKAWPLMVHASWYEFEASLISREELVARLASLGRSHPYIVSPLTVLASMLAALEAGAAAQQVLENIPLLADELVRFQAYSVMLAKWDLEAGLKHSFVNNVNRAREMYPADPEPLWLLYTAARKDGNWSQALQAVNALLKLDPHDKAALQALTRVLEDAGRWSMVVEAGERFLASRRAISEQARKEVQERVRRAREKIAAKS